MPFTLVGSAFHTGARARGVWIYYISLRAADDNSGLHDVRHCKIQRQNDVYAILPATVSRCVTVLPCVVAR